MLVPGSLSRLIENNLIVDGILGHVGPWRFVPNKWSILYSRVHIRLLKYGNALVYQLINMIQYLLCKVAYSSVLAV